MRIIELKTVETDDGQKMAYREVLVNTLKTHPAGMGLEEMEKVLRIVKTVRDANGRVALEDADHKYVSDRMVQTQWGRADSALVQFIKDVRDAPAVDAQALLEKG